MPTVIPPPPLSSGGDDRFHFSPGNANPELWATTTPLVVVHRCKRHKGLIATWRAIHWLIVLHSRSGRADFGVREIAEEADVGRNELCDTHDATTGQLVKKGYISFLSEERLIDIVGQVAVPGGRKPRNIYSVDLARLIAESALLAPEILRTYGAAAPPRPQVHPDQLTFFGLMEREVDRIREELGPAGSQSRTSAGPALSRRVADAVEPVPYDTLDRPENGPVGRACPDARPVSGTGKTLSDVTQPGNGTGAGGLCPENGTASAARAESRPENGMATAPRRPENGTVSHLRQLTRPENGTVDAATRPDFGTGGAHPATTPTGSRTGRHENGTEDAAMPSRFRDVGGMDGWMEAWEEGGREHGAGALAPSHAAVRELVRAEIEHVLIGQLQARRRPSPAPAEPAIAIPSREIVPPAPANELPIEAGPEQTWAALSDRELTDAERSKIRELIRRYAGPSQGTAAYWLVRAMNTVALDDKPLTLSYVGGVLKRLKRSGRWDSEELALAAGETREESRQEPLPSGKSATSRPTRGNAPEPGADLPLDLREAPAVKTYLNHAPKGVTLAESWAREILRRVRDLGLWESNCQNWRTKYDYSNVRGLLERHETDARAIRAPEAAGGHTTPADPLTAISKRLSLEEQERITAIADAIEERYHLDREAWTWVLVALADGRSPEEVEHEAVSRFSGSAKPARENADEPS